MNDELPLHKRLEILRKKVHEYTMRLSLACQWNDRAEKQRIQDALLDLWAEWDKIIQSVAKLEGRDYNIAEVLAQQEDE